MKKALFIILALVSWDGLAEPVSVTCSGKITSVGFLPQYGNKVLALDTNYRKNIWAQVADAQNNGKPELTMSLLLASLMADKTVQIRYKTLGSTSCDKIEQHTGGITIERVFVYK